MRASTSALSLSSDKYHNMVGLLEYGHSLMCECVFFFVFPLPIKLPHSLNTINMIGLIYSPFSTVCVPNIII